ncbi:unnamed protein product, partial [Iphiclides podalirius]
MRARVEIAARPGAVPPYVTRSHVTLTNIWRSLSIVAVVVVVAAYRNPIASRLPLINRNNRMFRKVHAKCSRPALARRCHFG